jgi:hypothetical protein
MMDDDDPLRPAAGVFFGCLLAILAWGLIVGGVVLLCVCVVLAWG